MKISACQGKSSMKRCAFCTNWYDPTNSVISPKKGNYRLWEFTAGEKKICKLKHFTTYSQSSCSNFEGKI